MIYFENFEVTDLKQSLLKPLNLTLNLTLSYGVIGKSGSGKSTFAKSLSMLLSSHLKTKGGIFYHDVNLYSLKEKDRRKLRKHDLKYIVQEPFYALNPYLKIQTQLKEVIPSGHDLLPLLAKVELHDPRILHAYPHQLSGGQRQRLALLQALVCDPKVIIADEPTTALDPIVEKHILNLIKNYIDTKNGCLILVSHDLKAIEKMTDITLVFDEGELIEVFPSKTLFSKDHHAKTQRLIESLCFVQQEMPRFPQPIQEVLEVP